MINVLSLFDGMSCGLKALNRAGIEVQNYYSSEIDKSAKNLAQMFNPTTFQLGDIKNWKSWGFDFGSIDLILAGFPCQAWSIAGHKKATKDPRGELAIDLMEIFTAIKKENPNVRFLFENVKMRNDHNKFLNELFGVESIEIDSALVSAQSRKRNYWTNIPGIKQPKDLNINLIDILDDLHEEQFEWLDEERSDYVLKLASLPNKARKEVVKKGAPMPKNISIIPKPGQFIYNNHLGQNGVLFKDKAATVVCAGQHHCVDVLNEKLRIRKLTVSELEKLQTLQVGSTVGVSKSARKKIIGNGWNIDTIVHILKGLKEDLDQVKMEL